MYVSEERGMEREDEKISERVKYLTGFPFKCSIIYTGEVFLFVANQLASCVDNTDKLCFIFTIDIAIQYIVYLNK